MSTLAKAGRLLDLFTADVPEWGVSEVAASLGIPRSTAHSLLTGLTEMGLLQLRRRGRYELGWRAFELGELHRSSSALVSAAHPVLESTARRLGETVCLSVLLRDRVLFVAKAVGDGPLSVLGPRIGTRYEAHAFPSGRLLLAARAHDEADRRLEGILPSGVSFDRGEFLQDVGVAATGVRGPGGRVVAALSISAPLRRFARHEPALAVAVRSDAARVAERLRE
ncbi:IclR family transcriptional regulator [Streptomyces sp. NPDC089424]|uniref:IclR family transcriptional regulator n=1 Tax=Streptomyces sp. NPDC089424 TaxID=3365917 RepID=UPI003830073F